MPFPCSLRLRPSDICTNSGESSVGSCFYVWLLQRARYVTEERGIDINIVRFREHSSLRWLESPLSAGDDCHRRELPSLPEGVLSARKSMAEAQIERSNPVQTCKLRSIHQTWTYSVFSRACQRPSHLLSLFLLPVHALHLGGYVVFGHGPRTILG